MGLGSPPKPAAAASAASAEAGTDRYGAGGRASRCVPRLERSDGGRSRPRSGSAGGRGQRAARARGGAAPQDGVR